MHYIDIVDTATLNREGGLPPVVQEHFDLDQQRLPEGWREVTDAEYEEYATFWAYFGDHFDVWHDKAAAHRAGERALADLRKERAATVAA